MKLRDEGGAERPERSSKLRGENSAVEIRLVPVSCKDGGDRPLVMH